jgi:hypothetical protein
MSILIDIYTRTHNWIELDKLLAAEKQHVTEYQIWQAAYMKTPLSTFRQLVEHYSTYKIYHHSTTALVENARDIVRSIRTFEYVRILINYKEWKDVIEKDVSSFKWVSAQTLHLLFEHRMANPFAPYSKIKAPFEISTFEWIQDNEKLEIAHKWRNAYRMFTFVVLMRARGVGIPDIATRINTFLVL